MADGVPPVAAVDMMAAGLMNQTGCIPPELIEPTPILEKIKARGMNWDIIEKTAPIYKAKNKELTNA